MRFVIMLLSVSLLALHVPAQQNKKSNNLVYVDKTGVLRWTKNNNEASFFGVNYTVPFAYSYRAHKMMGADIEKAIHQDVYHLARLGLDAFRVHVWDTEISDSAGNLIENEHLRLFDFLIAELKKRNIKTIITPIAFWNNGYPEKDEMTPGFSRKFGKGKATSNDTAIVAQENYLHQFFKHINPYTKLTYGDDPDVLAVELNNEPSHSGSQQAVTNYINRLAAAVKSTGWSKPLYYNISQNPFYASAVAKANVDGFSFQWYPTGLVANQEVKGNFLPNVDHYTIPYDTIPEYHNKSRMVYEFDAADVLQSCMYPAIARSFREAGFQWATQFAYDPMALAYANTEYQTHYLNIAFTPSKAISLMIAAEVFRSIPRLKSYGNYPQDSVFDAFRVSYRNNLSEMNTDQKFYYSNTTQTKPFNASKLSAIAGVGSSPVVRYRGSGAYFLDKIAEGVWRLEVMPDAIHIRDPFEKASPKKEVTRIQWQQNTMQIVLPGLGTGFSIQAKNEGNDYTGVASADSFEVWPGTYLLTKAGIKFTAGKTAVGVIGLDEYAAPKPFSNDMFARHEPVATAVAGIPFTINAKIVGIDTGRAMLQVSRLGNGQPRMIQMISENKVDYHATVPAELIAPGELSYRIILKKGEAYAVFPGNSPGDPFAWDNYNNETWKTYIIDSRARIELFNPFADRTPWIYPSFRRNFQASYTTGELPGQLILRLNTGALNGDHIIAMQQFIGDKLKGKGLEEGADVHLFVRARTAENRPVKAKVTLTNADAVSWSSFIMLTDQFTDIEVPLTGLAEDAALIMPRPYPGFLPLQFKAAGSGRNFKLSEIEKIEISVGSDALPAELNKPYSMELVSVWVQKDK
jgi:hypothetical protein